MVRYIILVSIGVVVFLIVMGVLREFLGGGVTVLIYAAILLASIVVIARNLMSNRKVVDASAEQVAHALTFAPEPGKAVLYILRKQFVGMAVGVNLQVDGIDVAQIKSPRFTRVLVRPGAHNVAGYVGGAKAPKPGTELGFNAEAGNVLFVLCEVEPQMVGAIVKFSPLSLEQARNDLHKARMVAPDVAEV